MTDKELFYQRIKEEYQSYVMDLDDYNAAEMMEEAEFNGNLKEIYEYLMRDKPIDGEQLAHFMKMKQPLHFICEAYQEDKPPIYETLNHTIWSIEDKGLLDYDANEESDRLVDMMLKEYNADGVVYGEQLKLYASEALAKSIFEKDFCFPEYDAKILLQFKKPFGVLLDLYRDSKVEGFENQYPKIMAKIQSMDILTGPYAVNKDAVLPETRYRHAIINKIIDLVPEPDYGTTAKWLVFFRELNMEAAEDSYAQENPYERFGEALEAIAYTSGDEVLQQLYELPNKHQPILENELIGAAEYLSNGGDIAEIPKMAENGNFDGVSIDDQQGGMDLC